MFWRKKLADLESEHGQSHSADILFLSIQWMAAQRQLWQNGKDPKDSNIRIAPSFPTVEELAQAAEIFVLSVKLVSVEKLLGAK